MQSHRAHPYYGLGLMPMAMSLAVASQESMGESPCSIKHLCFNASTQIPKDFKYPDLNRSLRSEPGLVQLYVKQMKTPQHTTWGGAISLRDMNGHILCFIRQLQGVTLQWSYVAHFLQLRHQGTGVTQIQKSGSSTTNHHYWMNRLATHFCLLGWLGWVWLVGWLVWFL